MSFHSGQTKDILGYTWCRVKYKSDIKIWGTIDFFILNLKHDNKMDKDE